jgi:ParB family chromosome partitioning protein
MNIMTDVVCEVRLDDIKVGERSRKDMGDIKALAESIKEVGLLHPIVISPEKTLIAGQRRLEAVKLLGWQEVPARVVRGLEEID